MALYNIDLHTHTIFSDGELLPAELVRRMDVLGYRAMALTDHVDSSRMHIIEPLIKVCRDLNKHNKIKVLPGAEITHVPPAMIKELTRELRGMGARLIVVHGETLTEPVAEGTNRAALKAGVDILAHPGLLTESEAALAARQRVALEITTRQGHSLTNGHVAALAKKTGAPLVVNSDAHSPADLKPPQWAGLVAQGAGLRTSDLIKMMRFATKLIENIF